MTHAVYAKVNVRHWKESDPHRENGFQERLEDRSKARADPERARQGIRRADDRIQQWTRIG